MITRNQDMRADPLRNNLFRHFDRDGAGRPKLIGLSFDESAELKVLRRADRRQRQNEQLHVTNHARLQELHHKHEGARLHQLARNLAEGLGPPQPADTPSADKPAFVHANANTQSIPVPVQTREDVLRAEYDAQDARDQARFVAALGADELRLLAAINAEPLNAKK